MPLPLEIALGVLLRRRLLVVAVQDGAFQQLDERVESRSLVHTNGPRKRPTVRCSRPVSDGRTFTSFLPCAGSVFAYHVCVSIEEYR